MFAGASGAIFFIVAVGSGAIKFLISLVSTCLKNFCKCFFMISSFSSTGIVYFRGNKGSGSSYFYLDTGLLPFDADELS